MSACASPYGWPPRRSSACSSISAFCPCGFRTTISPGSPWGARPPRARALARPLHSVCAGNGAVAGPDSLLRVVGIVRIEPSRVSRLRVCYVDRGANTGAVDRRKAYGFAGGRCARRASVGRERQLGSIHRMDFRLLSALMRGMLAGGAVFAFARLACSGVGLLSRGIRRDGDRPVVRSRGAAMRTDRTQANTQRSVVVRSRRTLYARPFFIRAEIYDGTVRALARFASAFDHCQLPRVDLPARCWKRCLKTYHAPELLLGLILGLTLGWFAIRKLLRHEWIAGLFCGWFVLVLAPMLLLPDHVSSYYLTIPSIGLAWLAGWAIAAGWKGGGFARIAVVVLAAVYFAGNAAGIESQTLVRGSFAAHHKVVEGVAEAAAAHPGDAIALQGVDDELYHSGFDGHPFLLVGAERVGRVPGDISAEDLHTAVAGGHTRVLEIAADGATRDVTGLGDDRRATRALAARIEVPPHSCSINPVSSTV